MSPAQSPAQSTVLRVLRGERGWLTNREISERSGLPIASVYTAACALFAKRLAERRGGVRAMERVDRHARTTEQQWRAS